MVFPSPTSSPLPDASESKVAVGSNDTLIPSCPMHAGEVSSAAFTSAVSLTEIVSELSYTFVKEPLVVELFTSPIFTGSGVTLNSKVKFI